MRPASILGKLVVLLGLLLPAAGAQARELRLTVAALRSDAGSLEQVDLSLHWPEGALSGELRLRAARAQLPALAYSARELEWTCALQRRAADAWQCAGTVRVAGQGAHPLALSLSNEGVDARLQIGRTGLALARRAATPELTELQLQRLPVAWLQAFAETLWADGRWRDGRLDGQVQLRSTRDAALAVVADLKLAELALETPDGSIAAAGLGCKVHAEYRVQAGLARTALALELRGGELLAGGLYVPLPKTPVQVEVRAEQDRGHHWRFPKLSWRDGEVLRLQGSASLGADLSLHELDLDLVAGDLAAARDRYLSGFLAPAGFSDLLLGGGLAAGAQVRDGELHALRLDLRHVNAVDPRQRFVVAGLHGDLRWSAESAVLRSGLGWDSGAFYGIGLGAARFELESAGGEVHLRAPSVIPVLQGALTLEQLHWQPPGKQRGTRFQLGATMADLDLASLSQRLGWPPFTGRLGGRIPSARYERGVLTLDGGLAMQVFGGEVRLSELVMERPFGVAPTLSAGVLIDDLDLQPLTAAFGFGTITGRLDGRFDKVRLVDWSPVAFAARLDTDRNWKGKRRISQRAVNDISSVAGSGLIAGLQAQVLKVFDDFGYARIGLGCTLRDNVCRMEGLSSGGDGYTIVEGAGLPRIQIVGFRRRVDWPTLVARLKAATEGQTPVVQ